MQIWARRSFLKTMALAGAAVPMAPNLNTISSAQPKPQIANQCFGVYFDLPSGRFSVWRADGSRFLIDAVASISVAPGSITSADPRFAREIKVTEFSNSLGSGRQIVAFCRDTKRELDLELRLALYDARETLEVEAICRNTSKKPRVVETMHPVQVENEQTGFFWPNAKVLLTNGPMYYDAGRVYHLKSGEKYSSWWNVGFSKGDFSEGLVIGYLENKSSRGRIHVRCDTPDFPDRMQLSVESRFQREFTLNPGASVSSDRVHFHVANNPFSALESYAQSIGNLHNVALGSPANGWCSWFSFFGAITEEEVVRTAAFAGKHLKAYGLECIQVDDGFYRAFGDWEGNNRFPHGMRWLAETIRSHGLTPGIWLAPYVIAEGTEVHLKHPEWLVHHPDGRLKQIGPGLVEGTPEAEQQKPKLYSLDITHPDAANWLRNLFERVVNNWGYDFVKIDFVEWSLLAADRYYDPAVTKAAAYRKGVGIMREVMGSKRHLLDCGPGNVSVGLIDSMRIELDQPPVTWQQYFLHPASTAPASAKRYYFHKRAWINDADHIVLANLSPCQAQAAASIVSLSGGNVIAGDRLPDLDTTRLEILKKAFPSFGEAARPIDLFESDRPEVFALNVRKDFGEWIVLGLFNADQKALTEKRISLERLGLDKNKSYVAFDFWNQRFFGEIQGELSARIEPASALVLAIHEKSGVPQLISTDRHLSQGGVEIESVNWENTTKVLSGVSRGPKNSEHNVYVYLPDKHPWRQADPFMFYDFPGYTLKIIEEHILRIHVRFNESQRVHWKFESGKFAV